MVERQARNLEVRGLNPGSGSNFSLGFKVSNQCIIMINDGGNTFKIGLIQIENG